MTLEQRGAAVLYRIACVIGLGAALSGCGAAGSRLTAASLSPERPGTSIKIVNPNPSKWAGSARRVANQPRPISLFACKPLACAGAAYPVSPEKARNRSPCPRGERGCDLAVLLVGDAGSLALEVAEVK